MSAQTERIVALLESFLQSHAEGTLTDAELADRFNGLDWNVTVNGDVPAEIAYLVGRADERTAGLIALPLNMGSSRDLQGGR